ncbi:head-tail connector protein [Vibrio pelagius]|uniref:head-tail connector protein n=1 Tax=Vibrio pelagius TaxID=28169 RepID=UPI00355115C5
MITHIECIQNESPVDLLEVKQHLRIAEGFDDVYLAQLIEAAIAYVETKLNRKIRRHRATYFIEEVHGAVLLPYGETNVAKVTTDEKPLAAPTDYVQGCSRVVFPTKQQSVTVTFECGYTKETCPADIRHALLLLVGTMYEQRMDISIGIQTYKAHFSSEHLLQPHKLY